MRPPLNAGENGLVELRWPRRQRRIASMRPPLNAGENVFRLDCGAVRLASNIASMRPPLNAGENMPLLDRPVPLLWAARTCFNEAPAERGGKRA